MRPVQFEHFHLRIKNMNETIGFEVALATATHAVGQRLRELLDVSPTPEASRLAEAMRYAVFSGGKRLRPFLILSTARLFGTEESAGLGAAAAVECLHAYSLVHDDLPAMDDDDIRRGRPSLHRAFDEATAILAGDALLTLAFEIMSDAETCPDPATRIELVSELAKAAGWGGMAAGQALDMEAKGTKRDDMKAEYIARLKAGALIRFSAEAGAIIARASTDNRARIRAYSDALGLALQLSDDMLDDEVPHDEHATQRLAELEATALTALKPFGERAESLRGAIHFIAQRAG